MTLETEDAITRAYSNVAGVRTLALIRPSNYSKSEQSKRNSGSLPIGLHEVPFRTFCQERTLALGCLQRTMNKTSGCPFDPSFLQCSTPIIEGAEIDPFPYCMMALRLSRKGKEEETEKIES